jgi:hypothetical protein
MRCVRLRWGTAAVAALIGVLVLPAPADAGRAVTEPCRTVFCAGVSADGMRVVFPFEEELTAGAGKRQIYEWSAGKTRALLPSGLRYWVQLDEVSADGAHVFVTTNLSLTQDDADGFGIDVFDVSAAGIGLISTGPLDPQVGGFVSFVGASPDGGRAFFDSFSPLTSDDHDGCPDLYQRYAGQTTLVAPEPDPPPAPPLCNSVAFGGVSADGSHLFFSSADDLEPADERGEDIYQQVGSTFTRLTTYPEPEGTCVDLVKFVDASSDGGTVLFTTNSPATAEDTDSALDVYKRGPDGAFTLVSRGSDGGSGQCGFGGDRAIALSADGGTAIFETTARLSPADTDSSNDLYSVDAAGTISLLSTGPADPNRDERSPVFPDWLTAVSDDARRVAFETRQPFVAADRDQSMDVYLRSYGTTELVSRGLAAGAKSAAELLGLSADGRAVVFATKGRLTKKDGDKERDVYLRRAGRVLKAATASSKPPRKRHTIVLVSAESIAPRIRVGAKGRLLSSGRAAVRLACPKTEKNGPCRGKVTLGVTRRGKAIGRGGFRIASGRSKRVEVRVRALAGSGRKAVFARVRGIDRLGNGATVVHRVSLLRTS